MAPAAKESQKTVKTVAGSLALAASLVVAVFIGVGQPEEAPTLVDTTPTEATPLAVQPVSTNQSIASQPANLSPEMTPELIELDEEKQRRLRAYLNQHDRMSRMNNTQLVTYPNQGK